MDPSLPLHVTPAPRIVRTPHCAVDAAAWILDCARAAISTRGLFRVALSGGNTPRAVHAEIIRQAGDLPWERVQITFGDERCVAPDDAASNYRMARESLLEPSGIPAGNVFRLRGEIDPATAAAEYEGLLAAIALRFGESRYTHDLIILGLGEDGHTASLFPGSPALDETVRNVIPAIGPKPPPQRLTFTLPLINAARAVLFLVNDPAKDPVIDDVLAGRADYPSALVRPTAGTLTWMVGTG